MADTGRIIQPGRSMLDAGTPVTRQIVVQELADGRLRVVVSPETLGFGDACHILERALRQAQELRAGHGIRLK